MRLEDSTLYNSSNVYLNGPDGMNNEVTMWSVGAGLLVKEAVRKFAKTPFGGLHEKIGFKTRKTSPSISILDVCSGPGNFPNYIGLFLPKIEVVGIDINGEFVQTANERFSKYGWVFLKQDARNFNLGREFDFALASSAYHHIEDKDKIKFLVNIRNHLNTDGKAIVCENLLPCYSDFNRKAAVESYYSSLRNYYSDGNATLQARKIIEEVYDLELSGIEEHKVDFRRFSEDVKASGLEIELDISVWQPNEFKIDNAGSHVFLLKRNNL